jgi:hypothetical protein
MRKIEPGDQVSVDFFWPGGKRGKTVDGEVEQAALDDARGVIELKCCDSSGDRFTIRIAGADAELDARRQWPVAAE